MWCEELDLSDARLDLHRLEAVEGVLVALELPMEHVLTATLRGGVDVGYDVIDGLWLWMWRYDV